MVFHSYERASQLYGRAHVFVDELLREVEHVACGQYGLPFVVELEERSGQVTVSSEYLLSLRVPHYELAVWHVHRVELVEVACFSRSSAGFAECYFPKASYFAHYVRGILVCYHVYFVIAFVGASQSTVGREFFFQQLALYRGDYLFHYVLYKNVFVLLLPLCGRCSFCGPACGQSE